MNFSDLHFIFIFLPISLALYYGALKIFKNSTRPADIVLFFLSVAFYVMGAVDYVPLLIGLMAINYLLPLGIEFYGRRFSGRKIKLFLFVVAMAIDIGAIMYFKILGKMPLGLSFYMFQLMAYVADVYMDRIQIEYDFIGMANYCIMFPRLIQGPLGRYEDYKRDRDVRTIGFKGFYKGLVLFIVGLSFKVIIADQLGLLWNMELKKIGYESISTALAWLGAVAYSFQLYYDFFGYSLMAVGLGSMFGFSLPDNFDSPYASKSISEFWRRWHITLGKWFKDYVYIPLGGNRKGQGRMIFGIVVVWLLTSIWHGITVNFFIWGAMICCFILIEKLFLKKYLDKSKVLGRLYVLFVIPLSWVVFSINDLYKLGVYFSRLFPFVDWGYVSNVNPADFEKYFSRYWWLIALSAIFAIPFVAKRAVKLYDKKISVPVCIVLFGICMYFIGLGIDNPFMYASF